jgi:hypothetical protein
MYQQGIRMLKSDATNHTMHKAIYTEYSCDATGELSLISVAESTPTWCCTRAGNYRMQLSSRVLTNGCAGRIPWTFPGESTPKHGPLEEAARQSTHTNTEYSSCSPHKLLLGRHAHRHSLLLVRRPVHAEEGGRLSIT